MFAFTQWKIEKIIKKIKALQSSRLNNQPKSDQLNKEISYYFKLANLFKTMHPNQHYPFPQVLMVECYKAAASIESAEANFLLGQLLLDEAKYREKLHQEGIFDSKSGLSRMTNLYQEALAHLQTAEKLGHIQAKRLRGLCLINGWGVEINKDAGFELVVESIENEGSWDKVPQIFAAIGLNKPEFFAAIMQRKK